MYQCYSGAPLRKSSRSIKQAQARMMQLHFRIFRNHNYKSYVDAQSMVANSGDDDAQPMVANGGDDYAQTMSDNGTSMLIPWQPTVATQVLLCVHCSVQSTKVLLCVHCGVQEVSITSITISLRLRVFLMKNNFLFESGCVLFENRSNKSSI